MADSTRDFTLTRNQIINSALRKVGAIGAGEEMTPEQTTSAIEELNTIVKSWQSDAVFLWTIQEEEITFAVSVNNQDLEEGIIGIDRAFYRDSTDNDTPLRLISWREYCLLTDKSSETNTPTHVAIKTEAGISKIYLYPTPSEEIDIRCLLIKKLKDLDTASSTPDLPSAWIKALVYALASNLADDYALDVRERQYLENKAEKFFLKAKRGDIEYQQLEEVASAFPRFR